MNKLNEYPPHSLKTMVVAIEKYYGGESIKLICKELEIDQPTFNTWLAEYRHIAVEFIDLKTENEKLRKMFVDLTLKYQHATKADKDEPDSK